MLGHVLRTVQETTEAAPRRGRGGHLSRAEIGALLGADDLDAGDSADPIRHHLFHLLRQILADADTWPAPAVAEILGQAAARAIGVLLGQYYFCQVYSRDLPEPGPGERLALHGI
jgi:hypothetical protein